MESLVWFQLHIFLWNCSVFISSQFILQISINSTRDPPHPVVTFALLYVPLSRKETDNDPATVTLCRQALLPYSLCSLLLDDERITKKTN